jgi:hypothetical protein
LVFVKVINKLIVYTLTGPKTGKTVTRHCMPTGFQIQQGEIWLAGQYVCIDVQPNLGRKVKKPERRYCGQLVERCMGDEELVTLTR